MDLFIICCIYNAYNFLFYLRVHLYLFTSQAHVYHKGGNGRRPISDSGDESRCSAFLANIDQHNVASVHFQGHIYTLPPWSVSILPDCRNVAYNTAKVLVLLGIDLSFLIWLPASINSTCFTVVHMFLIFICAM